MPSPKFCSRLSIIRKVFFSKQPKHKGGVTLEKKAIIDEVFRETGVTLDEVMHFKIQEVNRPDDMQDNCERCGKEVEELYWRDSSVYDLTVLKCPKCEQTNQLQLISYRGANLGWEVTRYGHASRGKNNSKINNEIRGSLSRKRITVSMQYVGKY